MKIFKKIEKWFKGINWKEVMTYAAIYAVQATLNCIAGVIIGYVAGWNTACHRYDEEFGKTLDRVGEAVKLMNENNCFIDEFVAKHQDVTSENLSEVLIEYTNEGCDTLIDTFNELDNKY